MRKIDFIRDPSLVLYLPLYKEDGSSFASRDACGHLCTATGAIWTPAGRKFDGVDDVITVPDHNALDITAALTIEAWVNLSGFNAYQEVVSKNNAPQGYNDPYLLRIQDDGTVFGRIGNGSGDDSIISPAGVINLDHWYHLVFTHNADYLCLFANAESIAAPVVRTVTPLSNTTNLSVGKGYYGKINGLIGEVRLYRRALSYLEVQHNYLAAKWRYR